MKYTVFALIAMLMNGIAQQENQEKVDCAVVLAEFDRVQTCEKMTNELVEGFMSYAKTNVEPEDLSKKHDQFILLRCPEIYGTQYKQHPLCGQAIYDLGYEDYNDRYESMMIYQLYCPEKIERQEQLARCQYDSEPK